MHIKHDDQLEYIQLWKESGLTKAEFCRQMGIRYQNFMAWIYNNVHKVKNISEHRQDLTTEQQIVSVSITDTKSKSDYTSCLIIHLKDALLEIPPGFPSEEVEYIITTLRI